MLVYKEEKSLNAKQETYLQFTPNISDSTLVSRTLKDRYDSKTRTRDKNTNRLKEEKDGRENERRGDDGIKDGNICKTSDY